MFQVLVAQDAGSGLRAFPTVAMAPSRMKLSPLFPITSVNHSWCWLQKLGPRRPPPGTLDSGADLEPCFQPDPVQPAAFLSSDPA